jgi:phosphoglycerol transferase MdoB-like AlkP superfamily enzyme
MERSRVAPLALFLTGCLALATAGIYIAFVAEHGTDIGHWHRREMALIDLILLGTPVVLIAATGFAWVHATRAVRGLPITRRTYALVGVAALFAAAMAVGRPRSEAVALFADHVVRLAS